MNSMSCTITPAETLKRWVQTTFLSSATSDTDFNEFRDFFDDEDRFATASLESIDPVLGEALEFAGIIRGAIILSNPPTRLAESFVSTLIKNDWSVLTDIDGELKAVALKVGKPAIVLLVI